MVTWAHCPYCARPLPPSASGLAGLDAAAVVSTGWMCRNTDRRRLRTGVRKQTRSSFSTRKTSFLSFPFLSLSPSSSGEDLMDTILAAAEHIEHPFLFLLFRHKSRSLTRRIIFSIVVILWKTRATSRSPLSRRHDLGHFASLNARPLVRCFSFTVTFTSNFHSMPSNQLVFTLRSAPICDQFSPFSPFPVPLSTDFHPNR